MISKTGITDEVWIKAMRDTVAEFGVDHVYQGPGSGCQYSHDQVDLPGCVVGEALKSLGFTLPPNAEGRVKDLSFRIRSENLPDIHVSFTDLIFGDLSPAVLQATYEAQWVQDDRASWGHALERFESYLEGQDYPLPKR